jgi:mono/diheme cytochrome c family protein
MLRRKWCYGIAGVGLAVIGYALAVAEPTANTTPSQTAQPSRSSAPIDFNRDIRPILSDHCFACHGPDEKSRKSGLRLDRKDDAFKPLRDGGYAIVPGKPDESELFRRITAENSQERMPPKNFPKRLKPEQIELIRQWILQGAPWAEHWAFVPPQKPNLPAVQDKSWPRNAIDYFILARLEREGLKPAPEADKITLARRVSLDLTGLPPTPAEVDAFLADTSPDAYEKLVQRLLDSPRYGEHMARYWLDAVRYGDTHGMHLDNYREIWPYRDWVVRAFNANLPYDQFITWQLAGDLLPNPTEDQLIATGYIRCHITTNEGGSIEEEVYVRNVVDRVENFATVMLGMTFQCAQCHDHKYDPVTMRDFYSLFAFFNSMDGPDMDGNRKDPPPVLKVASDEQKKQLADLRQQIAGLQKSQKQRAQAAEQEFSQWLAKVEEQRRQSGSALQQLSTQGLLGYYPLDEKAGSEVRNLAKPGPNFQARVQGNPQWVPGKVGGALRLDGNTHVELGGRNYDFERDRPFSYGAWVKLANGNGTVLSKMNDSQAFRGWDLFVLNDAVMVHLIHSWPDNAIKITAEEKLQRNEWVHLFVTYDGSSKAAGLKLYINGKPAKVRVEVDNLRDSIRNPAGPKIGRRTPSHPLVGEVDEVRIYERRLSDEEVAALYQGDPLFPIAGILAIPAEKRTPQQKEQLKQFYLERFDSEYRRLAEQVEQLRAQEKRLDEALPVTLIYRERPQPRPAYILIRGEYDRKGEQVGRNVPAFLPGLRPEYPLNRLGLAQWLLDRSHPLTARVAVNRFWQQVFGTGLVKTAEDFGRQGEPPSHPELLDWLAVHFQESGWNVKELMRLLVTSATYRQSAVTTPEKLAKDPQNRLLSRGPRFRMDGEMLRDQALFVSGLLVERIGGPPVKLPQPPGIWEAVGFVGSNTREFRPDTGREKVHRRSLYAFWKRTAPPPQMTAFDAPSREQCVVRRERTNTPLQALVLMNEVQYLECARALAERGMKEGGKSAAERIRWMFRLATCRWPDAQELATLQQSYETLKQRYLNNPSAANQLIQIGESKPDPQLDAVELAALTLVGNAILNLDEVLNK